MAQPLRSPDGQWFWDGTQWRSLISPDGRSIWTGDAWQPLPPGTAVSAAPGAAPIAAVPPPPPAVSGEPRPAWLPADQPWPPPQQQAATGSAGAPAPPLPPIDWQARRDAYFGPQDASGLRFAGFWIRFLAAFVDGLIITIPLALVFFAINAASINAALANQSASTPAAVTSPTNGLSLLIGFLYFGYFWATGSTPGMRLLGLQVVDATTGRPGIGFGKAALRYLGYVISSFCCYVGLVWAAFDPRKQGWHDKLAGTYVVFR